MKLDTSDRINKQIETCMEDGQFDIQKLPPHLADYVVMLHTWKTVNESLDAEHVLPGRLSREERFAQLKRDYDFRLTMASQQFQFIKRHIVIPKSTGGILKQLLRVIPNLKGKRLFN